METFSCRRSYFNFSLPLFTWHIWPHAISMRIPVSVFPAKHCQHRFAWVFLRGAAEGAGLSSGQCERHVDSVISWSPSECAERDFPLPNFCVLSFAAALNIHVGQIRFCFLFSVFVFRFLVFCLLFFLCALSKHNKQICMLGDNVFYYCRYTPSVLFLPFWPNFLIKCTNGHISAGSGYSPNLKLHFMLE